MKTATLSRPTDVPPAPPTPLPHPRKKRGRYCAPLAAVIVLLLLPLAACSDTEDKSPPATTSAALSSPVATATVPMVASDSTPGPGGPVTFSIAFPNLPAFERPVAMIEVPGQERMLLALQDGRIVSFEKDADADSAVTALDLTATTSRGGNEEGLLGMALDPQFTSNGFVYLYYNVKPGDRRTQISRFSSSGTGDSFRIDPASELPILTVPQPASNHNGGQLAFGPDGMLYLGLGDGGSQRDPNGYGQDLTQNLLGSIIRIDVRNASAPQPYAIPADNPFASSSGGERKETWAYGLRNPWRFSFDRVTGALIAGDVGQGTWEEIDLIERGGNYGWNTMEGSDCLSGTDCNRNGLKLPIAAYTHDDGCSVTGGYVYRGERVPQLSGAYVYADYCSGMVWSLPDVLGGNAPEPRVLRESGPQVASFAEDLEGELYLLAFDGKIYSINR